MSSIILFDMDGVLIDSRQAMRAAWIDTNKIFGLNIPFDDYIKHVGLPFNCILNELNIKSNLFEMMQKEYGIKTASNINKIKIYRGVKYLIKTLKKNNFSIGIVTSKEFWRADYLVDYFGIYTDILITPEFTSLGKPSGEPIIKALELLKRKNKSALYVGDMSSDYEAAKAAKIDYIHASWGYGKLPTGALPANYPEEILEFLGL